MNNFGFFDLKFRFLKISIVMHFLVIILILFGYFANVLLELKSDIIIKKDITKFNINSISYEDIMKMKYNGIDKNANKKKLNTDIKSSYGFVSKIKQQNIQPVIAPQPSTIIAPQTNTLNVNQQKTTNIVAPKTKNEKEKTKKNTIKNQAIPAISTQQVVAAAPTPEMSITVSSPAQNIDTQPVDQQPATISTDSVSSNINENNAPTSNTISTPDNLSQTALNQSQDQPSTPTTIDVNAPQNNSSDQQSTPTTIDVNAPQNNSSLTQANPSATSNYVKISDIEKIQYYIKNCWSQYDYFEPEAKEIEVEIYIKFNQSGVPIVIKDKKIHNIKFLGAKKEKLYKEMSSKATLSVIECTPVDGLNVDNYSKWKEIIINFTIAN